MKVYFIPGLGADKRVFKHICLPEGFDMIHLDWLPPEKEESLQQYARRMGERMAGEQPFVVVGLSFGGMLATEICKQFHPFKTILIASVPARHHLPPYFRAAAPLGLHKLLPIGLFKNASLAKRIFTTETNEDKALLRRIIRETDPDFIRWAIGAILKWKSEEVPPGLYHIHGTGDHLLPVRYVHPTHILEKGGHLMVMNKAEELNKILKEILLAEQA